MDFPIAIQLYSVRDDMDADFEGTLKKIKALGYEGVEFAGLYGHNAKEVKEMCGRIGLNPISAHVPFTDMINNPDILSDYAEIGCKFVAIPYLTEEYRPGQEKFADVIKYAKVLGEKAKSLGMKLCYHNHDFEFVKIDGEYALDILYKEVPSDILQTELDTCWVNIGGENPAKYVRKYAGRCEILHLKDFAGQKSDNMYALIGIDEDKKAESESKFEFRPVGYGVQDFYGILNAAKESDVKWIVVEQDEPSMNKTPMECAELSINYLKTL